MVQISIYQHNLRVTGEALILFKKRNSNTRRRLIHILTYNFFKKNEKISIKLVYRSNLYLH